MRAESRSKILVEDVKAESCGLILEQQEEVRLEFDNVAIKIDEDFKLDFTGIEDYLVYEK